MAISRIYSALSWHMVIRQFGSRSVGRRLKRLDVGSATLGDFSQHRRAECEESQALAASSWAPMTPRRYAIGTRSTSGSTFSLGVEQPSTGLTPKATWPRELRLGRSVQRMASTSLRAVDLHGQLTGRRSGSKRCARRLQCAREDRRLRVREIRMGHGSRGQQGWTLATATRAMKFGYSRGGSTSNSSLNRQLGQQERTNCRHVQRLPEYAQLGEDRN